MFMLEVDAATGGVIAQTRRASPGNVGRALDEELPVSLSCSHRRSPRGCALLFSITYVTFFCRPFISRQKTLVRTTLSRNIVSVVI